MNAEEIKALGNTWGAQNGLLSVAELTVLMAACQDPRIVRAFEVGHYYGLSTCALVHAFRKRGGDWKLTTLDAHVSDRWVELPATIAAFEKNQAAHFDDPALRVIYQRSEIVTDVPGDFVFYDGDHGAEQLRFTKALIDSPSPRIFLFDDRDFDFPKLCCAELEAAGWVNKSPKLSRLPGDKTNPDTQTLARFERER